ncbi:MAG: glycosyltransferase family 2 protein [Xanthomonadales bacterium]|nr:glycosyltransferase family 2 protein [Xanthomonadales bacterium]
MPEIVPGLVSTIIPAFNRADMLRHAVDSVLAQTWRPIEILICDDGSTDDTVATGQRLEADHPGVVFYEWAQNRGAGSARERGRLRARGEFIQYLDSDDSIWPRKFEVQIAALRAKPECGAAYGWIRLCPEGEPPGDVPYKWSGREFTSLFPMLLVDRWWNTNAPLWRRTTTDAIGPWSDLRYSQDWEYDARAGGLGIKLVYCPEFVTDQRQHSGTRQTGGGRWLSPQDRVRFFAALLANACRAGVALDAPEMKHFARWVFRQARECGASGDAEAAADLLTIARAASGGGTSDMSAYGWLAKFIGWKTSAIVSDRARAWLGRRSGADTLRQSWMD